MTLKEAFHALFPNWRAKPDAALPDAEREGITPCEPCSDYDPEFPTS